MRRGLMYKYSQNRGMFDYLMATGNKRLVEESYQDPYWGGMLPGSLNKLGNFLIEFVMKLGNSANSGHIL